MNDFEDSIDRLLNNVNASRHFFVPRRGEGGESLSNRWQARRGPTGRKPSWYGSRNA